ncbi:energy transducer TonB family protein [Neorhizobium sp. NPDC001467]|uniref:energy transducer TonB family protein n=1 Tax=Neorhizobium sp. NPDC001467 TaxID=3390595 RepID=UPI003D0081EA
MRGLGREPNTSQHCCRRRQGHGGNGNDLDHFSFLLHVSNTSNDPWLARFPIIRGRGEQKRVVSNSCRRAPSCGAERDLKCSRLNKVRCMVWMRGTAAILAVITAATWLATGLPSSAQETLKMRVPQNEAEWMRFVRGRLQRYSGSVVAISRRQTIFGHFTLAIGFIARPDGSVSDIRIVKSSGNETLDETALQIPTRAAPLPTFPADMPRAPKSVVAPLEFTLTPPAKATAP